MSKYQIVRWDAVTDCNGILRPMLYFKPDMDMVLFARDNNFKIHINISDAQYYTGTLLYSTVDIASQQPNYRPNFFEACHLYVITLSETNWLGFPGPGLEGTFSINKNVVTPQCWRAIGPPGTPKRTSVEVANVLETPSNLIIGEQEAIAKEKAQKAEDDEIIKSVIDINTKNASGNSIKKNTAAILLKALKDSYSDTNTQDNILLPRENTRLNLRNVETATKNDDYDEPYRSSQIRRSNKGLVTGLIILAIILFVFIIILSLCSNSE